MKNFDSNLIETMQNESGMENLQIPVSTYNPEDGEEKRPLNDSDEFDAMVDDFLRSMREINKDLEDESEENQCEADEPAEESESESEEVQSEDDAPEVQLEEGLFVYYDPEMSIREICCYRIRHRFSYSAMINRFEEFLEFFNELAGLDELKEALRGILRVACLNKAREEAKMYPIKHPPYHFIFSGNPGTGKTTVAKLIGDLFWLLGYLDRGRVICHTRGSLVGGFIGQTEERMEEVLEEAKGNVLFIDEAYSLFVEGCDKDYGQHVMESLLTVTADPKCDMVVILAGYKNEMEDLINSNPGIRSRFNFHVNFKDFSDKELSEIAHKLLLDNGLELDEEAQMALDKVTAQTMEGRDKLFGNGRWITNFITNGVIQAMAKRVLSSTNELTRAYLSTVTVEDIQKAASTDAELIRLRANVARAKGKHIGFRVA